MRVLSTPAALLVAVVLAACGNKNEGTPAPVTTASSMTTATSSAAPEAPASLFSVVLESRAPIVFSGLEGGVTVVDASRARLARLTDGELRVTPMPAGLPQGAGRVVRIAGRMPSSLWLSFEERRDDGKVEASPLFRLTRDTWKELADNWTPVIAAWSKNRILAASTSSGKLKIKVIEPSLPKPPSDLPNVRLTDPSCDKTLVVVDLAALRSGEVAVAGVCKPDTAAGAGASAKRYVVIRWPAAAKGGDAGAEPDGGPPGIVDVIPGFSAAPAHQAMLLRAADDMFVAAREDVKSGPPVSRLFHFDGATWSTELLPQGAGGVRGLAAAADGTLWMATEGTIQRRAPGGSWETVAPPGAGKWEIFDVRVTGDDVWVAARLTAAGGARDLLLRSRPAKDVVRWE